MADKKITDLTTLTSIAQNDLLVVVSDPSGTPITKKIVASSLFGNVTNITVAGAANTAVVRSVLDVNASPAVAGTTLYAGEFIAVGEAAATVNVGSLLALKVRTITNAAAVVVTGNLAAAHLTLDVSNTTTVPATNTYGLVIAIANTGTRVAGGQPTAFLRLEDSVVSSNTTGAKYLLSANVANGSAAQIMNTVTSIGAVSGKIAIQINGTNFWIPLCTAGGNS